MTEASRVQKMLTEQNAEIDRLNNRIEKLEAALSDIIVLSDDYDKAVPIARQALDEKMTNDLVKRLRSTTGDACRCGTPVCLETADRIKKLEAVLNSIADVTERWEHNLISQVNEMSHKALEWKDGF